MAVTRRVPVTHLSIVGAGTMGSGIALAALYRGWRVRLFDLSPEVLVQAEQYVERYLAQKGQEAARDLLTLHRDMEALAPAELWVEAAPEDLGIKQKIFRQIDLIAEPQAILATNTSTLSISSIAASTKRPERVIGLHFFNPAAVIPLVELVSSEQTGQVFIQRAEQAMVALGKTVVAVNDSPGFIVNRVARPFYGEALQLLSEGLASIEQIDALVEGFGFPMGPFRLMDFIGNDVNLAATRSVFEQSFMEPRYRPHILQQRLVEAGKLGKKSGQGFYQYPLPEENPVGSNSPPFQVGETYISSTGMAPGLEAWLRSNDYPVTADPKRAQAALVAGSQGRTALQEIKQFERDLPDEALIFCQAVTVRPSSFREEIIHPERLIGFDSLCMAQGEVVALTADPNTPDRSRQSAETWFRGWGKQVVWVTRGPGLVLPRIMAMLVNEAAFAVQEKVASPEDIDRAMKLGVRYPWGPLAWGKRVGYRIILNILDSLRQEQGDPRYRAALALRRWAEREPE